MAPTTAARAAVLTPRCAANDAPAIPPIEAAKAADDVVDTLATLARSGRTTGPVRYEMRPETKVSSTASYRSRELDAAHLPAARHPRTTSSAVGRVPRLR